MALMASSAGRRSQAGRRACAWGRLVVWPRTGETMRCPNLSLLESKSEMLAEVVAVAVVMATMRGLATVVVAVATAWLLLVGVDVVALALGLPRRAGGAAWVRTRGGQRA